jgi:hypothetical protein
MKVVDYSFPEFIVITLSFSNTENTQPPLEKPVGYSWLGKWSMFNARI